MSDEREDKIKQLANDLCHFQSPENLLVDWMKAARWIYTNMEILTNSLASAEKKIGEMEKTREAIGDNLDDCRKRLANHISRLATAERALEELRNRITGILILSSHQQMMEALMKLSNDFKLPYSNAWCIENCEKCHGKDEACPACAMFRAALHPKAGEEKTGGAENG